MTKLNTAMPAMADQDRAAEFDKLKQNIHSKLVDKLDLSHVGELEGDVLRREIPLSYGVGQTTTTSLLDFA